MDSITHSLTGIGLNYIFNKEKNNTLERKIVFISFLTGSVIPDIDIFYYLISNTEYLIRHRGISHSLIGLIILPFLITLLLRILFTKNNNIYYMFIPSFIGVLSHILLDVLNAHGTMALWPINNHLYSFNILMIIDVVIIVLLITSLFTAFFPMKQNNKRNVSIFVFTIIIFYILSRTFVHLELNNYLKHRYSNKDSYVMSTTLPPILGINSWPFIIKNKNEYIIGDIEYSSKNIDVERIVKRDRKNYIVKKALDTRLGDFLKRFSNYLKYDIAQSNNKYIVTITDMRHYYYGFGFKGKIVLNNDMNVVSEKIQQD